MSPPSSTIFTVQQIPGAGRGVIASAPITTGDLVYRSGPPTAHVIFWQYRKEVCAHCFYYDRGRNLPVRRNAAAKVFCTEQCQSQWLEQQGDTGVEAWELLTAFIQSKSKSISNSHSLPSLTPKPKQEEIEALLQDAITKCNQLRTKPIQANGKNSRPLQHSGIAPWTQIIDPDILSYLLSGLLHLHAHLQFSSQELSELALDPQPYRSTSDLRAHSNSIIQLSAILPPNLVPDSMPQVCHTIISAASHNSFGLRSGSSDGEEYLGYGLYPGASYFNHSCRPNIGKKRVGSVWEFWALRGIEVGEECCITYLGGDEEEMTVVERRSRLGMHWGFECNCARCREEGSEVAHGWRPGM